MNKKIFMFTKQKHRPAYERWKNKVLSRNRNYSFRTKKSSTYYHL